MKCRDVIRLLRSDGWTELPRKGTSHVQFKHATKPGKVTVPMHAGDVSELVLRSIERQSGVRLRNPW